MKNVVNPTVQCQLKIYITFCPFFSAKLEITYLLKLLQKATGWLLGVNYFPFLSLIYHLVLFKLLFNKFNGAVLCADFQEFRSVSYLNGLEVVLGGCAFDVFWLWVDVQHTSSHCHFTVYITLCTHKYVHQVVKCMDCWEKEPYAKWFQRLVN